jgi:hypothetical protein
MLTFLIGLKALNALLQREYSHEVSQYKVHKKIANMLCDMGFVLSENPPSSGLTRYHRIVKQTDRHMIVVTYKVRRRLIQLPVNARDEHLHAIKENNIEGEGFGHFLKKHGLVPPDMMGYDEEETKKEYEEGLKDPTKHLLDDDDDETFFDIALINKKNQALVCDCKVRMGEIMFDRFFIVHKDADEFVRDGIWFHKTLKSSKFYGMIHGP